MGTKPEVSEVERVEEAVVKVATRVSIDSQRGIYFLLADDVVVYVGQSNDVLSRVRAHRMSPAKEFNRAALILIPEGEDVTLDEAERFFIDVMLPRYNSDATTRWMRRTAERSKQRPFKFLPDVRPEFILWLARAEAQPVSTRPVRRAVPRLPLSVRRHLLEKSSALNALRAGDGIRAKPSTFTLVCKGVIRPLTAEERAGLVEGSPR